MRKTLLALAAFAATATAFPVAPVFADPPPWAGRDRDDRRGDRHDNRRDRRDDRRWDRHDDRRDRIYDSRGRYAQPRRIDRNSRIWRGNDGRYYCKRDNGTTGLIIGAGVGALAGHQIAGNGDRTLGAILGGVLGGALGREIDKGDIQCR
ncbi:glycine zipper 2TM domain-containing protein [Novosphingobium sp. BL-52-GroH]|uniref:glycine zipper 2TM domain-containing protein n=1 Tax=Novosphingobium sp. BL-52-GroH TaxID=3349877 RepID=UPI00384B9A03